MPPTASSGWRRFFDFKVVSEFKLKFCLELCPSSYCITVVRRYDVETGVIELFFFFVNVDLDSSSETM